MAKSRKKISMANYICTVIMFVTVIGVIVGLFVDYVGVTVSGGIGELSGSHTEFVKLFDMEDTWGTLSIVAAIATAVFCALGFVLSLLKNMGGKRFGSAPMIVGAITVLLAIFAIVCVFVYGGEYSGSVGGNVISAGVKVAPAFGAWLLAACGVISGIASVRDK